MGDQDGEARSPYSGSNLGGTKSVYQRATKGEERANEGDGTPTKDANEGGLNSPPPTPALGDEQRGATEGLNALSPAAPTREGSAVASDDARDDENIVAADVHSAEPVAQRDVEVTGAGAGEESDGTYTAANGEIRSSTLILSTC